MSLQHRLTAGNPVERALELRCQEVGWSEFAHLFEAVALDAGLARTSLLQSGKTSWFPETAIAVIVVHQLEILIRALSCLEIAGFDRSRDEFAARRTATERHDRTRPAGT